MNVLEKITKEIEERVHMVENIPTHGEDDFLDGEECYEDGRVQGRYEELVWCRGMIHSNMDDAADMNNGWIPVEERLPENGTNGIYDMQLVTLKDGEACLGVYRNEDGEWWTRKQEGRTLYTNKHEVIAFQPLPKPYKPEEN